MLDRITIEKLQQLIRTNLDCYNVLTEGCDRLQRTEVAESLRQLALDYGRNAEDLKRTVGEENVVPGNSGSRVGLARELWLDLRVAFESDDLAAVIAESERIASEIMRQYQESIAATRPLSELLPKQYARVKKAVDALRAMRVRRQAN